MQNPRNEVNICTAGQLRVMLPTSVDHSMPPPFLDINNLHDIPPPQADFSAPPPYDVAANSKLPTYEEVQREKQMEGEDLPQVFNQVLVALSFYATGSYQRLVGGTQGTMMSQQSVSRAIREVSNALNSNNILNKWLKFPSTRRQRDLIKQRFYEKFKIPAVTGCIDGTHVAIVRPSENEERFYNRKGYHSRNVLIMQGPPPNHPSFAAFVTVEPTEGTAEQLDPENSLLGTDIMFLTSFFVAFLFNWIGFLLLMCFCHTVASRYGALAGFGLSLAKWTLIVKHSTELASHENSWLWWLIMAFGILICVRAIIQYLNIKRGWRLLSGTAQERLLFFY